MIFMWIRIFNINERTIGTKTERICKYSHTITYYTRVVPKVMDNFFFACELETADEGECGGRWNQLLCYT